MTTSNTKRRLQAALLLGFGGCVLTVYAANQFFTRIQPLPVAVLVPLLGTSAVALGLGWVPLAWIQREYPKGFRSAVLGTGLGMICAALAIGVFIALNKLLWR
jgi:hypothetical protein